MNDIAMFETGNGGDFVILADDFQLSSGVFNIIYLALFGGNVEASTGDALPKSGFHEDWWGNSLIYGDDQIAQFNSKFEKALINTALNSSGRSTIENVAKSDLKSVQEFGEVSVSARVTGVDRLEVSIKVNQPTSDLPLEYTILWDDLKNEIIINETVPTTPRDIFIGPT